MKEVRGNLWTHRADIRVITTNGFVKRNGEAVMGRGCALEASRRYPEFPKLLGEKIDRLGNIVHIFEFPNETIITFPVKHMWAQDASFDLIRRSTIDFLPIVIGRPDKIFVMPRPGCGNGKLKWGAVKPLLEHLPDNVHVITFPGEI